MVVKINSGHALAHNPHGKNGVLHRKIRPYMTTKSMMELLTPTPQLLH